MKLLAFSAALLFSPAAALAHQQPTTGETCRAFRNEETYVPGYTKGMVAGSKAESS